MSGSWGPSPFRCISADPEHSGGAPSLAQAPAGTPSLENLLPLLGHLSSGEPVGLSTGRAVRQEGERKEDRGLGKKQCGGDTHSAGKAGPNLAVSYFRTVPWGPQTRDPGGGGSGCANALTSQEAVSCSRTDKREGGEKARLLALVLGDRSLLSGPERVCGCWYSDMFMMYLEEHAGLQMLPLHDSQLS